MGIFYSFLDMPVISINAKIKIGWILSALQATGDQQTLGPHFSNQCGSGFTQKAKSQGTCLLRA